ncbi:Hypothetical protein NTJ_03002 [Nesidiocoris tenuis]|uniref:Uncharacterized protein n=1 Tax=Nesidiocoris tenuis TaxID=355587 RepID=A0ABN7AD12_9HEMI|nr:Hypothetical protein NTJ_03002 [Nesidiocoris tenuis]
MLKEKWKMKKEKQACSWEDHLKTGLGPATWTRTPFKPGSTKLTHIAVEPAPPFGRSPTFLRMEGRLCLSWLMYNEEYPRFLQGCSQMGSRRPWGHLTLDDAQWAQIDVIERNAKENLVY